MADRQGPDDLSSTLRYQRDSFTDWLRYYVDFLCNGWWKLARYFYQHGRYALAGRTIVQEGFSVLCVLAAVYVRRAPAIVIFVLPLVQLVRSSLPVCAHPAALRHDDGQLGPARLRRRGRAGQRPAQLNHRH